MAKIAGLRVPSVAAQQQAHIDQLMAQAQKLKAEVARLEGERDQEREQVGVYQQQMVRAEAERDAARNWARAWKRAAKVNRADKMFLLEGIADQKLGAT